MLTSNSTTKSSRTERARPIGLDYRKEVEQRIGAKPHLLRIDALGNGDQQRRPYELAEGIALIDIAGYLCSDPWYYDETGYSEIGGEVQMALEDSAVKGILLRVNSPGGEADGCPELADFLAQAGKQKPMYAVADTIAYSAAYWLASQAQRIFVPPVSGGVGSIGVWMLHADYSKFLEQEGVNITILSRGEGKTAGNPYEPLSDAAKKDMLASLDRIYGAFVGAVARGRGMSVDAVQGLGAWLYEGSKASLAAGLSDSIGGSDDAWLALVQKLQQSVSSGLSSSASAEHQPTGSAVEIPKQEVRMETTQTTAETKASPPAAPPGDGKQYTQADVDRMIAEAKGTNRAAELEEIAALCQIAGKPARAAEFIGKGTPLADVRKTLQAESAEAAGAEISNKIPPQAQETNTEKGLGSLIVISAKARGAEISARLKKGAA